jgi:hypothetical protein
MRGRIMTEGFYLLKIQLQYIEPAIWRRFVVPADITLDRLHDVIQIIMGWEDCHLHEFTIGKKRFTEYPESPEEGLPCGKYRIGDLVRQKDSTFHYLYDFGDSWEHELTLEDNHYFSSTPGHVISCINGENACPPEDVGGIPGFEEFCKAINNPNHKEHKSYMEWYGRSYNRKIFNLHLVNWRLLNYFRWSRDRHLKWGWNE